MNYCKICGKPLTLTPEYDTCMECQGRIMRESTIPQNSFTTNSTKSSMDIYDEVEEALEIVGLQSTGNNNEGKVKDMFEYKLLVKALERAKKEHELLELYQLRDNYQSHTNEYHKIQKAIKTLEKEQRRVR